MATSVRLGVVGLVSVPESDVPHVRRLPLEGTPARSSPPATNGRVRPSARGHGIPAFTDPHEVLSRHDVDAATVLVSMSSHGPLARAALEAGKQVLLERPTTSSALPT